MPFSPSLPCLAAKQAPNSASAGHWAFRAGQAYSHVTNFAAVRVALPTLLGAVRGVGTVASRRAVALLELRRTDGGSDQGVPSEVKQLLLVDGGAPAELTTPVARRAGTQRLLQYKSAH